MAGPAGCAFPCAGVVRKPVRPHTRLSPASGRSMAGGRGDASLVSELPTQRQIAGPGGFGGCGAERSQCRSSGWMACQSGPVGVKRLSTCSVHPRNSPAWVRIIRLPTLAARSLTAFSCERAQIGPVRWLSPSRRRRRPCRAEARLFLTVLILTVRWPGNCRSSGMNRLIHHRGGLLSDPSCLTTLIHPTGPLRQVDDPNDLCHPEIVYRLLSAAVPSALGGQSAHPSSCHAASLSPHALCPHLSPPGLNWQPRCGAIRSLRPRSPTNAAARSGPAFLTCGR